MSYEPLYKVFYKCEEKWQEVLDARYASENTEHINLSIAQINRKKSFSAFFMYHKDILDVMIQFQQLAFSLKHTYYLI